MSMALGCGTEKDRRSQLLLQEERGFVCSDDEKTRTYMSSLAPSSPRHCMAKCKRAPEQQQRRSQLTAWQTWQSAPSASLLGGPAKGVRAVGWYYMPRNACMEGYRNEASTALQGRCLHLVRCSGADHTVHVIRAYCDHGTLAGCTQCACFAADSEGSVRACRDLSAWPMHAPLARSINRHCSPW